MKLLVTGATGYIGRRLVRYALSKGHEVIAASRRPATDSVSWVEFDLFSVADFHLDPRVDAIIHLAAVTAAGQVSCDQEIAAAMRLIRLAKETNTKFIFVSSQTACVNAPTPYGRTKWQIEQEVLAARGMVVRPGQVYGGPEAALFGKIVSLTRRLPMIPALLPAPKIQPIHVDDLVTALVTCATSSRVQSSVLCLGAENPVSFTRFLRIIARQRIRRFRPLLPLPSHLLQLASRILGQQLSAKIGLQQLTSLFQLPFMLTTSDLQCVNITLRPLESGMFRSGDDRRHNLIREGFGLLGYILGDRPSYSLIRRYVEYVECVRDGQAIYIPNFLLGLPQAMVLMEKSSAFTPIVKAEFNCRLDAAIRIAEASVQGGSRFHGAGLSTNFITGLLHIFRVIALELCSRVVAVIALPVLKPMSRRANTSR